MYKLIVALLLVTCNIAAQDFDSLQLRDTIYVLFDEHEKFDDLHLRTYDSQITKTYSYVFPDVQYLNFLTYTNGHFTKDNLKICKKQFYKSKPKIITINAFHSAGFNHVIQAIDKKKIVVYIIESKGLAKRKMLLKRAYMQNVIKTEI